MTSFVDFDMPESLLRGLYTHGFEHPSQVQTNVIPVMLQRKDVVVQSPSGTGKTAAFVAGTLGLMLRVPTNGLILSPSRELAHQTCDVVTSLAQFIPTVKVVPLVGGTSRAKNIQEIRTENLCVVVGTPGRTLDILTRSKAFRQTVGVVILDEADQLIEDRGFQQTMASIFGLLPSDASVGVFSATFDQRVDNITCKFLRDPVVWKIDCVDKLVVRGISQYAVNGVCTNEDRINILDMFYKTWSIGSSIIFCSSRARVDWLADQMESRGFSVSRLHAGYSNDERCATMAKFRAGESRVLIATQLIARGIDVQTTQLVVLCDMISDKDTYLHAVGRCGRFGRKGVAVVLLGGDEDQRALQTMQDLYNIDLKAMPQSLAIPELENL